MSKPGFRGDCVFCDKPIPTSDPPEHVMPKWLRRFRPKKASFEHRPGFEVRGDEIKPISGPVFRANQPEARTNVVCQECNKGWMSDLEVKASQILPELIEGGKYPTKDGDQRFIAEWVTKTVMMWQTVNPSMQIIPPSDYSDFYQSRELLPFTRFLLGCYKGEYFGFMWYTQDGLFRTEPTPIEAISPVPDGYRSILVIGGLVFEVVGSCDEYFFEPRWPNLVGDVLVQIWPSSNVVGWAPQRILDDEGMRVFLDIPPGAEAP